MSLNSDPPLQIVLENLENLIHILTSSQAYSEVRSKIFIEMNNVCEQSKSQVNFLDKIKSWNSNTIHFKLYKSEPTLQNQ